MIFIPLMFGEISTTLSVCCSVENHFCTRLDPLQDEKKILTLCNVYKQKASGPFIENKEKSYKLYEKAQKEANEYQNLISELDQMNLDSSLMT